MKEFHIIMIKDNARNFILLKNALQKKNKY
jgi:hypothetical protein